MNLLVVGEPNIEEAEAEVVTRLARKSLYSIQPSKVFTSYREGWELLALDESTKLGVPFYGAMPFPQTSDRSRSFMRRSQSNTLFNPSYEEFIRNPYPYFNWIRDNVDEVLVYRRPESLDTLSGRVLRVLKGKTIRNMYRKG